MGSIRLRSFMVTESPRPQITRTRTNSDIGTRVHTSVRIDRKSYIKLLNL